MLDLFMIRHGETVCNAEGRHTGWLNYSLNENGIAQAKRAAGYMRDLPFDRYYCSDIQRTRDTFAYIFGEREDCEYNTLLREADSGRLAGITYEDCERLHGDAYRDARKYWHFKQFGGEDIDQVMARAKAFMEQMEALPKDVRRVAAVSHGGLIRCVACNILHTEMPGMPMQMNNCGCCVFRLQDNGKWTIMHWNVQNIASQTDLFEK